MEEASIGDTIAYELAESLNGLSVYVSALGMSLAQLLINFAIPSSSGQALATLPIMIPTGELLGLTRQSTILAFHWRWSIEPDESFFGWTDCYAISM